MLIYLSYNRRLTLLYGRSSVSLKFLEKDVPNLRINKFISEAGKASRRGADKLIMREE